MTEPGSRPTLRASGALLTECPKCGGSLTEPVSGDLHCYVDCFRCGARFELDDPALVPGASPEPGSPD